MAAVRLWMSANRLATLLGGLILFSLVIYLLFVVRRRRETVVKSGQAKTATIVSPNAGHDEQIREKKEREVFEL